MGAARGFIGACAKKPVSHLVYRRFLTRRAIRLFGIDATLDPKKREAAEQLALQIIDEVKQTGVTADELEKAKKITLGQHLGALTTMRGQASDTVQTGCSRAI
jgi:Peptidase M16 inactive domain.